MSMAAKRRARVVRMAFMVFDVGSWSNLTGFVFSVGEEAPEIRNSVILLAVLKEAYI